jgi:hypothetical protein
VLAPGQVAVLVEDERAAHLARHLPRPAPVEQDPAGDRIGPGQDGRIGEPRALDPGRPAGRRTEGLLRDDEDRRQLHGETLTGKAP